MVIKGIIAEDFINYKLPSMVIEFPWCDFKCDKECGQKVCQNSNLVDYPSYNISVQNIIKFYLKNDITKAIVFQGLEPFYKTYTQDDWFFLVRSFREHTNDPIIIYTGYNEDELEYEIKLLKHYKNIIIKFGRFIPNQPHHYDEVLGVTLASPNQYSRKKC